MSVQPFLTVTKSHSQPLPNQDSRLNIQDAASFNFSNLINKTPFNRGRSSSPRKQPSCRATFCKLPEKTASGVVERNSSSQGTSDEEGPQINKFGTFPLGILKNGVQRCPVRHGKQRESSLVSKRISFA